MPRSPHDKKIADKAAADASQDRHRPPDRTTGEDPRMSQVWSDEQDRLVYERAHEERRKELQHEGTPYEGEVPEEPVPERPP